MKIHSGWTQHHVSVEPRSSFVHRELYNNNYTTQDCILLTYSKCLHGHMRVFVVHSSHY